MDSNKLIAEFMKVNIITLDDIRSNKDPLISSANGYLEEDLEYHDNWQWLMPVVEKIEKLGYEFYIVEDRVRIAHNTDHSIKTIIDFTLGGSKQDATYKGVVEFIKEYNKKQ